MRCSMLIGVKQGNNQVKNKCEKLTVKLKMVKKDNFTSTTVFKSTFKILFDLFTSEHS